MGASVVAHQIVAEPEHAEISKILPEFENVVIGKGVREA